jgi:hypothetical protein
MRTDTRTDRPSDDMRDRLPGSRIKTWVLLVANRWVVAATLLGGLFVLFVALGSLDPTPLRQAIASKDPLETVFQALVTAIVTGVTLVVTINQLVLAQELGPAGDQRDRMDGATAFRQDVETAIDADVSPADPASFLEALVDAAKTQATAVSDSVSTSTHSDLRTVVDDYVESLAENADGVTARLDTAQFGTFAVVHAALSFNYSLKIHEARTIAHEHDADIPDETREALDDLVDTLELFGVAREHIKTLYFQWELIDLSRAILYAAVPALAVSISMILFVNTPETLAGTTLGVDNLVWATSAAITVALVPFIVLLSYILRIVTVAKRTLAIGPFVLRDRGPDDS